MTINRTLYRVLLATVLCLLLSGCTQSSHKNQKVDKSNVSAVTNPSSEVDAMKLAQDEAQAKANDQAKVREQEVAAQEAAVQEAAAKEAAVQEAKQKHEKSVEASKKETQPARDNKKESKPTRSNSDTSNQTRDVKSSTAPTKAAKIPQSQKKPGVHGFCKDGTAAYGDPSAKGKANACYGHKGWGKVTTP